MPSKIRRWMLKFKVKKKLTLKKMIKNIKIVYFQVQKVICSKNKKILKHIEITNRLNN